MDWLPTLSEGSGPVYMRIVDALSADIASGRLVRGQQLPTHRALAHALDIDLTTVTRAYGEARRRGLLDARVGQGTFVSETTARVAVDIPYQVKIDLSMNVPPQPVEANLDVRIAKGLAAIQTETSFTASSTISVPAAVTRNARSLPTGCGARVPAASGERLIVYPGIRRFCSMRSVARVAWRRGANRGADISRNQGGGGETRRPSCRRRDGRRGHCPDALKSACNSTGRGRSI